MSGKSYKKGYRFEREIFNLFSSAGFYVIRSAGSHGVFDLVCVKDGVVFGIQCKYNNHLNKREEMAMKVAFKQYGIIPLYAFRKPREPLVLKDVINNRIIDVNDLPDLPKRYANIFIRKIIEKNGKEGDRK